MVYIINQAKSKPGTDVVWKKNMGAFFQGQKSCVRPIYLRSLSFVEQKMIDGADCVANVDKTKKEITVSRATPNIANIRISKGILC